MKQYNNGWAKAGKTFIYIIIILMGLTCLLPLLNIVAISFSGSAAVTGNQVGFLPVDFTLAPYQKMLADAQFWRSFLISAARVVLQLALNMVLIVLMAYPLSKSKREFHARGVYMKFMIFAMLFNGGMIPTYLIVKDLGLLNTIWSLILPGAVPIFNVILVMNFFAGVPKSLEEAAVIDGANPMQVLWKVYLPCSVPVLATIALFSIVGSWNDFFSGLIYITKVRDFPLMTYIQSLNINIADLLKAGANSNTLAGAAELTNKNLNAAKIVVSTIPLIAIYPFLQKYFVTGIVVGAVKE
ncbi:carbohydrate ABC transporter permease [Caproicibacterium amylolyticum]|uniref:Carbohydrate ABC transporter permease n=1 Tax=Caproicibacterium amylolyticum TaxID=2766537 RepID=A0A7G9WIG6_9FIRM|nr:carbohydrate ABC transporter permease [Caproicibacterium amylolyticum]QNO18478.1 carbohydrate ABC transporter permease [Caproicibacterium amylolyticum]